MGGERFFTPELKEYETRILRAQERIAELEADIFYRVCGQVAADSENILSVARVLAGIDVFSVWLKYRYAIVRTPPA
jgi:DNA mismatch repair protein MutS